MFFFFNDTATTEIYTLSLHDALPICPADKTEQVACRPAIQHGLAGEQHHPAAHPRLDRKSTRLNSSHSQISYAVFCLKKKMIKHHVPKALGTGCDAVCPSEPRHHDAS